MVYIHGMADLLALSTKIIDSGSLDAALGPVNRITQELSELASDLAVVESFSHVVAFRTDAGLLLFDTSGKFTGDAVAGVLRRWSEAPVHTIVYTHGHVDHVGGAGAFLRDGKQRGHASPRVVGHENVVKRFHRYALTNGYNLEINRRQFGNAPAEHFLPPETPAPTVTVERDLAIEVGTVCVELHHARGETDDHLWSFLPERRTICAGDFFIWNFPNAGNPQKVQRYPLEWAQALREMASRGAELFIPAHGLPIEGQQRIARVLSEVATVLESLVERTLACMNAGLPLDAILHEVQVDAQWLQRPYLRPLYDEPEFVVRNIYRLYGGWYDGNPSLLKPPREQAFALEVAALAGGSQALVQRARELASADIRLACRLVELAVQAAPEDREAHAARYELYRDRRQKESSLMAKGIFGSAAQDAWAKAFPGQPYPHRGLGFGI
jgi:alkyl sulfatase BDS1-like metallo-beta-lactamase superfamily hydrolase